jgi:hypothetical protein
MDDFSAARMILSGIPLDESFLQHWLSDDGGKKKYWRRKAAGRYLNLTI